MSDLPFEYHPEAIAEAKEAYQWYKKRSPEAADRFWNELVRARGLVCERPQSWAPYYHGTRYFQFKKFPYALVYVVGDDQITGIAVPHLHRRPAYWRKRV